MIAHPEVLAIIAVVGAFLVVLFRVFGGGFSYPLRADEDLHGPSIHGWDHLNGDDGDGGGDDVGGDGGGD